MPDKNRNIVFSEKTFEKFMQSFRGESESDGNASRNRAFSMQYKSLLGSISSPTPDLVGEVHHQFLQRMWNRRRQEMPARSIENDAETLRNKYEFTYGDNENKKEALYAFRLAEEILLPEIVGIPGLTRLYSEHYMHYEWAMHTEIKVKNDGELDWSYYRDHFTHQVRNAYAALELLDKLTVRFEFSETDRNGRRPVKMMETMLELLFNKQSYGGVTHTSRFFEYAVNNAVNDVESNLPLCQIYDDLLRNHTFLQGVNNKALDEFRNEQLRRHFGEYIVRSSLVMASLFHDFGYPIEYARKHSKMLAKLIDSSHYFTGESHNFDEIYSILSNSVLCRLVGKEEIRIFFSREEPGETHGCLSSLAFLLFFYESGMIYELPAEQQAAVELAAVVMYDHTICYSEMPKYKDEKNLPKLQYKKPAFVHSPLSYFFRFCDDIQEWERLYFKVSNNEDLRICQICHLPIVRFAPEYTRIRSGEEGEKDSKERKKLRENPVYICGCVKKEYPRLDQLTDTIKTGTTPGNTVFASNIAYRRINEVSACKVVEFIPLQDESGFVTIERLSKLGFLPNYDITAMSKLVDLRPNSAHYVLHIDYNHYKMLQMAIIDPNFAFFRMKELNQYLKPLVERQLDFPNILVYAVATMNPITLKVRMIEQYLRDNYPEVLANHGDQKIIKEAATMIVDAANIGIRAKNIFVSRIQVYIDLLIKSKKIIVALSGMKTNNEESLKAFNKKFNDEYEEVIKQIGRNRNDLVSEYKKKFGGALDVLLKEFFRDELRAIRYTETIESGSPVLPKNYYEQYWSDSDSAKTILASVQAYCRSSNFAYSLYNGQEVAEYKEGNLVEAEHVPTLDVYSDLAVFLALDRFEAKKADITAT